MLISGPRNSDPSRAKEVKVKIPVSYHVRLHSVKVLTGKPISDTVTEALEAYFLTHPIGHHSLVHDDATDGATQ